MQLTKKEVSKFKRKRNQRLRKLKLAEENKELKLVFFLRKKLGETQFSWKCKVKVE